MRGKRKVQTGQVVSAKMDKSIVVVVSTLKRHPLYKKTIRHKSRFVAHDEKNACESGDMVRIVATRPLSKSKRWRVVETITPGMQISAVAGELSET